LTVAEPVGETSMNKRISQTMVCLAICTVAGCGDGKPWVETKLKECTVSGTVSVKGKPASGGTILFNPSNSGRIVPTRTAQIGPDGSYTIKTYIGVNQVTFDGEVAAKNRGVGLLREAVDVVDGENKANFDLLGEGGGKKPLYPIEGKADGKRGKGFGTGKQGR
jgi:hypothetical protein